MKILWINNIELPEIAKKYNRNTVVGGWMKVMAKQLAMHPHFQLYIASPVLADTYFNEFYNEIYYFSFKEKQAKKDIDIIISYVEPDIIHIWGTEEKHAYYSVKIAEKYNLLNKTIISIQGLLSIYTKHYAIGLPPHVVYGYSIKELLGKPNISHAMKQMKNKSCYEVKLLSTAKHCIGRTEWDYACVKQINPNIQYHFCNETLRDKFYDMTWTYEKCEKHTVFFSQSHYPIKGVHFLIEAIYIVKRFFPDVKVRLIGKNPMATSFNQYLRQGSYQKYLAKLLKTYNLVNCFEWMGYLNEDDMVNMYCNSHVFVCSSTIENSSNSIGEAMLLGVPVIASDVGGIKSLMVHKKEGLLYQDTASYMLAQHIIHIFSNKKMAKYLSENARIKALKTHNKEKNFNCLQNIYKDLKDGKMNETYNTTKDNAL
jgi:glycosyltransferase involved in cell wall biosynthesis